MVYKNYFFSYIRNFLLFSFLFCTTIFSYKSALKTGYSQVIVFGKDHPKKIIISMVPVSFVILLLLLRELPHKQSRCINLSSITSIAAPKNQKIIIFFHGIGANLYRAEDAINQNKTLEKDLLRKYEIISLAFHETMVNKAFRTSFGQQADIDQVLSFLETFQYLKNKNPKDITFIAHSRSGQTLLNCVDYALSKEHDNENIKNILTNSKKIYVAPLLCLRTTIKDVIKKWYVPNVVAHFLSNVVCRFCLPFVTKGLYNPSFLPAIERMQHWTEDHFQNSKFFLAQHDELVGHGKTPELIDFLYENKKSNLIEFVEHSTHDSDNLLQAAFREALKE